MSRARPFEYGGETFWFDQKAKATSAQLELLADIEGVPIDDLLDAALMQRQVLYRLRECGGVIPEHVMEARRKRAEAQGHAPACRICSLNGWDCDGSITRHHFVPRWLMLELENYQSYAARSICTIPICLSKHRDLHYRGDGTPKSIVQYLREHERKFAQRMLDDLREQHPHMFGMLTGGVGATYEDQLIQDYWSGKFTSARDAYALPELQAVASATG